MNTPTSCKTQPLVLLDRDALYEAALRRAAAEGRALTGDYFIEFVLDVGRSRLANRADKRRFDRARSAMVAQLLASIRDKAVH